VSKWRCPGCGRVRATAFCPTCGDEPLRARDLSLRDLTGRFLSAFSSLDGRLARSFRTLLTRPGALTEAYVAGRRRAYLGPLQMFLLANALFFAVQSFTHFDISPRASIRICITRIGASWRGRWSRKGWRRGGSASTPSRPLSTARRCSTPRR
jgi:hypothetical protein